MNRYVRLAVLLACAVVPAAPVSAQGAVDPVDAALAALTSALPTPPIAFVGITPCRLADTRAGSGFSGDLGPPSMIAATPRYFPVIFNCGIPSTALAVSANIAVTNTSGVGFLSVWPGDGPQPSPLVASINYSAGQTIANAVLAPLGNSGITVYSRVGVDLIIDVNGYFDIRSAAGPAGPTGATGPQGPSGPSGPQGGPGPAGFSSVVRQAFPFYAIAGTFSSATVTCTPEKPRVIGGGAYIGYAGFPPLTRLQYSHPADSGNGWVVRVRNDGTFENNVTVFAYCAP